MNVRIPLLILSLAANLVGAALVLRPRPDAESAPPPAAAPTWPQTLARESASPPLWVRLEHSDGATFVRNLRAAGLPPDLIQALVAAHLQEEFAPRFRTLRAARTAGNYWEEAGNLTPQQFRSVLALQGEYNDRLRTLLGATPPPTPAQISAAQRRFGPLDPAKLASLEILDRDYESMLNSYRFLGIPTATDLAAIALLEQEREADLAALLTPSELFEYKLRRSDTARRMRQDLAAFAPTEAEFRAFLPLFEQLDRDFPRAQVSSPLTRMQGEEAAARQTLANTLGTGLSPTRAAELAQALKLDATADNRFVARLGLPLTVATRLGEVRTAIPDLFRSINAAPEADRAAAYAQAITRATAYRTELERLLGGPENLEAYRSSFGRWLTSIDNFLKAPPPTAAPPGGS